MVIVFISRQQRITESLLRDIIIIIIIKHMTVQKIVAFLQKSTEAEDTWIH